MSNRRHRRLPLPRSFKPERREHWLDRHERQVEEQEEDQLVATERAAEGQPRGTT